MPSPRYRVTPTTVPIERDPGPAGPTTTPVRVDMTTWTGRAACSTRPDWDRQSIPERIAICQTCPVVTECTTLAIDMLQQDQALRRVHDVVFGGEVLRDLWQRIKPPGHSRTASARTIGPTARTKARLQQVIAMHADGATPEQIVRELDKERHKTALLQARLADRETRIAQLSSELAYARLAAGYTRPPTARTAALRECIHLLADLLEGRTPRQEAS